MIHARTRPPLRIVAVAILSLFLASCSQDLSLRAGRSASPAASPSAGATGTPTPRPPIPEGSGFDPERVATVLGPAVATVVINTPQGSGEGSAFVIAHADRVSYLVTNNHVVSAATRVQVLMPDGRHFRAAVQGADPLGDIAVLRVDEVNLPLATFGDSSQLHVGQRVVAIGSPLGNQGTVTAGIISALHRSITAGGRVTGPTESLPDVLQTDAAINPGNSGGPLADAQGRVIGVNTATSSAGSNIGFAIPSNLARRIAEALIAGKKPGHPYLGVSYFNEQDALASGASFSGFGVFVRQVLRGCPAGRAGIREGDVIQRVDGIELNNGQTLGGVLQVHNPGDRVKLTVVRGTSTLDLDVTLADRPAAPEGGCG
jgi:putative serine protease PepD